MSDLIQTVLDYLKRPNIRALFRFALILVTLITTFALIFQLLMKHEGQSHSLISGFYWTLSTMSTLGYGDISFTSDLGRAFSIFVLLSGIIFMLVLLPFTFIELFYEPWTMDRARKMIPRRVADDLTGHVILTFYGPLAIALIPKLIQFKYPYVVILPDVVEVTKLVNDGIHAICGDLNDPDTFRNARVEQAALVATTRTDIANTSVAFTVRGIADAIPIIATAREDASKEILKLAGCSRVLDLTHLMADALARRAIGGEQFSHVIGGIDDLLIAEVDASKTTLIGKNYSVAQMQTSVSIVGFWARGDFQIGQPNSKIEANTVLVMAGSKAQLDEFDATYRAEKVQQNHDPVIIIGGGRVGRETARALTRRGIEYRIVEVLRERIRDPKKYIHGSGSDKVALASAGIERSPTVIITTHDDELNIYLTTFYRLLRPDIQIISRTTMERSVAALHRAGCDIVMSYASMGSNALFNLLQRSDLLMVAEGLDVFKIPVPSQLDGISLMDSNIRQRTGCTVIGIDCDNETTTNPSPSAVLSQGTEIVLIGSPEGERKFLLEFPSNESTVPVRSEAT